MHKISAFFINVLFWTTLCDITSIQAFWAISGLYVGLFCFCECLYAFHVLPAEQTRKLVHLVSGLITLLFPPFFDSHVYVLILSISFFVILAVSKRLGFLSSIHNIKLSSVGAFVYPIIVYISYLAYTSQGLAVFFYLPVLIMALADPAAYYVGTRYPILTFSVGSAHKSLGGSLAFFATALLLCLLLLPATFFEPGFIQVALFIAILSTLTEAVTPLGWDNFTIPLAVLAVMFIW